MSEVIKPALAALARGQMLDVAALDSAFEAIIAGEASQAQIGAFLAGLESVGVDGTVIAAGARAMRNAMILVEADPQAIDVCGTGGDGSHSLNVSTAVGLVLAGCGVRVAKHGNRAMSSRSGAGDVLEALGVNLVISPATAARAMNEAGIAFLFAQAHHPAMRHVAPVRRELGFRTVFNLLGPLSNPASVSRQLLGVYAADKVMPVAQALQDLGATAAWVVHGHGGVDELALSGPSQVVALEHGALRRFTVSPAEAGLPEASPEAIRGGDAAYNAQALTRLLDGEPGPYRNIVLFNAAAALIVAGKASTLKDGVTQATQSIDTGASKSALARLVTITREAI